MANQDVSIRMYGRLESSINVQNLLDFSVSMPGELVSSISPILTSDVQIRMAGELTSSFNSTSCVRCSDINVDFIYETIYSKGCSMAKRKNELERYRGDNYPVQAVLAVNGNYDLSGFTSIKMSTQIADGTIYSVDATVIDAINGLVEFPLSSLAVGTSGVGTYDIQGDTGTYVNTFQSDVFNLLPDLTV